MALIDALLGRLDLQALAALALVVAAMRRLLRLLSGQRGLLAASFLPLLGDTRLTDAEIGIVLLNIFV